MLRARKSDLIAVRMEPSIEWAGVLGRAWDAGAGVLPIDHRLPEAEVQRIVAAARPTVLDGERLPDGVPVDDGIGLVMATGGSMGAPKIVELPHDAVGAAVDASIARLGATAEDPWLCVLPFAHMGGLLCLLRATRAGAAVRFDGDAAFTSVVPTMLHRGFDTSGFKAVLVGGAALGRAPEPPLVATYGMTESCGGVVYDGVPLDGVLVRIAGDGEIQLNGPTLMRGYRFAHEQPFTADGWLRTNDAGSIEDGRLVVQGRLDDAIVTGGEKVWPDEVEAAVRSHPKVADVAVTARRDEEWGSIVVAHVVPTDRADPPTLDDLRAIEGLARYKLPRALELHEALPHLPSGKPNRRGVREARP